MISRCPSCGAPAPDEARMCRACGWDFVTNKKGEKKAEPPPKKAAPPTDKPKSSSPPSGGLSLPPARGGSAEVPATGLGMASLPKVEPAGFSAPATPDENPFALPVARNLGPKPGDSLFSSAPPSAAEPKLPSLKPKEAAPVEEEAVPKRKTELEIEAPPKKEPPPNLVAPKAPPAAAPKAKEEAEAVEEEEEDAASPAMFLPSSTKEIVVEPEAKRAEAVAAKSPADSPKSDTPKAKRTPVYLAASAGAALGLLSIGVIFVTLRSEPQGSSARVPGASPFGKRTPDSPSENRPALDAPAPAPVAAPKAIAPASPAPIIESEAPPPTTLPAPALSKPVEPPPPSAPMVSPKADQRPTATFAQAPRPQIAAPAVKPKPAAPVAAPKKPAGPQWVFEGTVYDLISTRGVFGVRLVFVDAEDNEVASIETADGGRYRATMKAGPENGYALRIIHEDYSGKHIDELDSTSSVRKADLEQRKFLLQAGARSLPWIGTAGKAVRRDMALVPKASEE